MGTEDAHGMMNSHARDLAAPVVDVEQDGNHHAQEELHASPRMAVQMTERRAAIQNSVVREAVYEVAEAHELRELAELVRAEERHHEHVDDGIEHEEGEEQGRRRQERVRKARFRVPEPLLQRE